MYPIDFSNYFDALRHEQQVKEVSLLKEGLSVFIGPVPLFVSADSDYGRVVVWGKLADITSDTMLAAARAAHHFNAESYEADGIAMALSVQLRAVVIGRGIEAEGLTSAELAALLVALERKRIIAHACLEEAMADSEASSDESRWPDDMAIRA